MVDESGSQARPETSASTGDSGRDASQRLREAVLAGSAEETWLAGLELLFVGDWALVRSAAGRPVDHDACFAIAECALRRLDNYVQRQITLHRAPPRLERPAGFLRRCAWRCAREGRAPDVPTEPSEDFGGAVASSPDLLAAVMLCLDGLSDADRRLFTMQVGGASDSVMAVALRKSPAAVRIQRSRARAALEDCLDSRGFSQRGLDDGGDDE